MPQTQIPNRRLLDRAADQLQHLAGEAPHWPPRSWRAYAKWLKLTTLADRLRAIAQDGGHEWRRRTG